MPAINLYFKVHQPYRLKQYLAKDVEVSHSYEDATGDEEMINTVANNCYLPANALLLSLIRRHKGQFKVSFSISGVLLELLQRYRPDVIAQFRDLTDTGNVEILAETYYHSLSYLHSKKEFRRQIEKHAGLVKDLLGIQPTVFRNTELIHNNELVQYIAGMGFKGMLCEGVDRILNGRTANRVYAAPGNEDFGLLLRHTSLSDDIAFRFDDEGWNEFPLTADKFAVWIHTHSQDTEVINLFMDYETFGVHKKSGSGIFDFLDALPEAVLADPSFTFSTPSEILQENNPADIYDVPQTISWEDKSKEYCVWSENMKQNNTLKKIYSLENIVLNSNNEHILDIWGRLQSADYFYYMADSSMGNVHKYQNPYHSPQEAYEYYTNIITDLEISLIRGELGKNKRSRVPYTFL